MAKPNISFCTGLLFLFLIVVVSCNKKNSTYEITGKLENVSENYFFLSRESGDSLIVDTVSVSPKGEFSFVGAVDTLTEMSLYFNQNTKVTYLLVDKGWRVELKGDVLYPDLISMKGGDVNDDLTAFKNKNRDLLKSRADIAAACGDSLAIKDYVVDLKNINFELSNIAAGYVKANPDKIASVMLINTFFKDESSIPRLDENLALLRGKAADFPLTTSLRRFSEKVKMSAEGAMAPDFILKDIKDKDIRLSAYRGKYVSLIFVSATCRICVFEKQDAIDVYNELKTKKYPIEFITIVKDVEDKLVSDSTTNAVGWPILPVKGGWSAKIFDTYYIREIPYNILISPTGIILGRDIPVQSLPEKMKEYTGGQN
jgi:hypothetical protein